MKKKIIIIFGILALIFTLSMSGVLAVGLPDVPLEEGLIIKEQSSGDIVKQQNQNERYYPASTTKLMTALVAMDAVSNNLEDTVTIGEEATVFDYDSSSAKLEVGEVYTYRQLLYGLLLPSGNDAANTIAANVGRQITGDKGLSYAKAIDVFIKQMNQRALEMGLTQTYFKNAHGLHDPEHYTTPAELLKISEIAFENSEIAKIAGTKNYEMKTSTGEKQKWQNSNMLLYSDLSALTYKIVEGSNQNPFYNAKATGGKTGNTEEAGRCFVFTAKDGDKAIVGVIMKGDENGIFDQADAIIDALSSDYTLKKWTEENNLYQKLEIENTSRRDGKILTLKTDKPYSSMIETEDEMYTAKPRFNDGLFEEKNETLALQEKIEAGQQVGELVIYDGDQEIKSTSIYAENEMRVKNIFDYLVEYWYITLVVVILVLLGICVSIRKWNIYKRKKRRMRKRRRRKPQ